MILRGHEQGQRRGRITALAVMTLVAVGLTTSTALAHDVGASDAHGDVRASADAAACAVDVSTSDVDAGAVTFRVLDASEGTLVTQTRVPGTPQPDPGPARFAHGATVHVTADEAARADQVVMVFEEDGETHSATASFGSFECERATAPPPCPPVTNVRSENAEDPEVQFTIHTVEGATAYRVYRSTDGGAFELLEQRVPGGGRGPADAVERILHVDEDVAPSTTYAYRVTAINAAGESAGCPEHEVTTIPFLGAPALVLLASVGSAGAYGALRARQ